MAAVNLRPLPYRRELMTFLTGIGLKTGDVIYRMSDTRGPLNIQFSKLVADATDSEYSHASVIYVRHDQYYALEVNDRGVMSYRLIDWFDHCSDERFTIDRYKDHNPEFEKKLNEAVDQVLDKDVEYDFTYSDSDKIYCTKSVAHVYEKAGIQLCEPSYIKDVLNKKVYWWFSLANYLFMKAFRKGFDTTKKLYFVGNEKNGIRSSKHLYPVVKQNPFLKA